MSGFISGSSVGCQRTAVCRRLPGNISTASGSNSGKCVQADLGTGAEGRNPVTLSRLVSQLRVITKYHYVTETWLFKQ